MRIHIATDHAGLELSRYLVDSLTSDGHELIDHGPQTYDPQDDYPAFCIAAAAKTVADPGSLGIVIGGSRVRLTDGREGALDGAIGFDEAEAAEEVHVLLMEPGIDNKLVVA